VPVAVTTEVADDRRALSSFYPRLGKRQEKSKGKATRTLLIPTLMSDVSSSTPSLTPQSTGTQDSSPRASTRKPRPQAAFYPNVNAAMKEQKPFSRSAAKRDSVMALGSIEHLQHYFTKTGLIAKKECVAGPYPLTCHLIPIQIQHSEKGPCSRSRVLARTHQGEPLVKWPSRAPTAPFTRVTCATAPFNHTSCQDFRSRPGEPPTWGDTGPIGRRGRLEAPR
jgi:hypothetical protein